ncbi:MAG: UvrB/UvrC motif-containing protein [Ignavibacteria bacterium]|nr:UvrB/UvrC motif-containing protein [Ignavibacteria bacterium]
MCCIETIDDYRDGVERARRFPVNVSRTIPENASRMEDAASTLDYEHAAMLRDSVREIEHSNAAWSR